MKILLEKSRVLVIVLFVGIGVYFSIKTRFVLNIIMVFITKQSGGLKGIGQNLDNGSKNSENQ